MSREIDTEKQEVDYAEKAYDDPAPAGNADHPEQDWTPEEEKAVVYVACLCLTDLVADTSVEKKPTGVSSPCCASSLDCRCSIEPTFPPHTSRVSRRI